MALDAGKEVSAGSGVDTEQWSIPQTIEEAIEQILMILEHICKQE